MYKVLLSLFLTGTSTLALAQELQVPGLDVLSRQWEGDRFADGRPKLSDALLERAKKIGFDDAWTILMNAGYVNQFEAGWKQLKPEILVVGRALTAQYLPARPDIDSAMLALGQEKGFKGSSNAWPIDLLEGGDVYVADGFGKIEGGTLIGQTLGTTIADRTGTGVVFDAAVRDIDGLSEIEEFNALYRDAHPSFLTGSMLSGINVPVRIGKATVLPGDLVLSNREGVLFIPAHLAEQVIFTAEFIQFRDSFAKQRIREKQYSVGEMDNQWSDPMKADFLNWLKTQQEAPKLDKAKLDQLMDKRTW